MQIADSVVFITGASSGIGLSLAQLFLEKGAYVCSFSRSGVQPELLEQYPEHILDIRGDITQAGDVRSCIQSIEQRFGRLHVVIANAGIAAFEQCSDMSDDIAKSMIDTNVLGMFYTVKYAYPLLKKMSIPTCIIAVHSIAATTIFEGSAVYSATKAGTLAMMRTVREESRKDGISVLDILPGATRTGIWSSDMLNERGSDMMDSKSVATMIIQALEISRTPDDPIAHIDEMVIRPWTGNL